MIRPFTGRSGVTRLTSSLGRVTSSPSSSRLNLSSCLPAITAAAPSPVSPYSLSGFPLVTPSLAPISSLSPAVSAATAAVTGVPLTSVVSPLSSLSGSTRMMSSYIGPGAALRRLEAIANADPSSASHQAEYLAALNTNDMPDEVVRRFESNRFAVNEEVLTHYTSALVRSNALPASDYHSKLSALRRSHLGGSPSGFSSFDGFSNSAGGYGGASGGYGASAAAFGGGGGNPENPLMVELVKRVSFFDQIMASLRFGVLVAIIYFLYQSFNKSSGMGKSPLEVLTGGNTSKELHEIPDVRFSDVKGIDEARDELKDIVSFLRDPERYTRLGAKVPRGVLLTGPPGTGKTLLARAVAGEAGVPFYSRSAAEFEEMLVGLGAKRVRELFESAQKNAPAIIFIDEIDAMGGKRGRVNVGGSSERQTLNQLLSCMDGFTKNEGVIVLAATNTPKILDSALTRPGRFDTKVTVSPPDRKGREAILRLYFDQIVASDSINVENIARATPGMVGADLQALVNSAALIAANRGASEVEICDIEEAKDKLIMGPSRTSVVQTKEALRNTAFHEAGHTLAALLTNHTQAIHKVTILPRGNSGGATYFLAGDNDNRTKADLIAKIDVAMGGRAAEEILSGTSFITTGAGSDMNAASRYARAMVWELSMGKHGLAVYDSQSHDPSPEKAAELDAEVEEILTESYVRVKALLETHWDKVALLANALLEHETLDAEQVQAAVDGKPIPGIDAPRAGSAEAAASTSKGWFSGLFGGSGGDDGSSTEPEPAPAAAEAVTAGAGAATVRLPASRPAPVRPPSSRPPSSRPNKTPPARPPSASRPHSSDADAEREKGSKGKGGDSPPSGRRWV